MSRHVRDLLATGGMPAHWQLEMARKTVWVDMLLRAGAWAEEDAALQYSLNSEPLLGRLLMALTAEDKRPNINGSAAARQRRLKPDRMTIPSKPGRHPDGETQKRVRKPESGTPVNLSTDPAESDDSRSVARAAQHAGRVVSHPLTRVDPAESDDSRSVARAARHGGRVVPHPLTRVDPKADRSLLRRLAGEPVPEQGEERPRKRQDHSFNQGERRYSQVGFQAMARQQMLSPDSWQNALITRAWHALHCADPLAHKQTSPEKEPLIQQWAIPIDGPTASLELLLSFAHLPGQARTVVGDSEHNRMRKNQLQEQSATGRSESNRLLKTDEPVQSEGDHWSSPLFDRGGNDNPVPEERPSLPDTFWRMGEGVSPGRPLAPIHLAGDYPYSASNAAFAATDAMHQSGSREERNAAGAYELDKSALYTGGSGEMQGEGSPPPNPATPTLTKTRRDESNVDTVRAWVADDVGRGRLWSPSSQKVSGREEEQPPADEQARRIMPPTVASQLPPLTTPQGVDIPPLPVATATVSLGARAEMTIEDDLDMLAARIKRILDDEARRHGIDV